MAHHFEGKTFIYAVITFILLSPCIFLSCVEESWVEQIKTLNSFLAVLWGLATGCNINTNVNPQKKLIFLFLKMLGLGQTKKSISKGVEHASVRKNDKKPWFYCLLQFKKTDPYMQYFMTCKSKYALPSLLWQIFHWCAHSLQWCLFLFLS